MDTLMFGLQITLVGFGLVVTALVALIFLITIQQKVLAGFGKKNDNKAPVAKAEPQPVATTPQPEVKKEDPAELVAVIAAAISAYNGQQVVVKNIRRVNGNNGLPWAAASRADNMNLRQMA